MNKLHRSRSLETFFPPPDDISVPREIRWLRRLSMTGDHVIGCSAYSDVAKFSEQCRNLKVGTLKTVPAPHWFSTSGGLGTPATVAYKRLAALLSEKQGKQYGLVMNWMRCKLSFSLLRSSITCLCGYQSPRQASGTSTNSIKLESIVCRIPQWLCITNYTYLIFLLDHFSPLICDHLLK
jgi:hypothetical protein